MVASVLGVVGIVALIMLGLGVMSPVLAGAVALIALVPLAVMMVGSLFRHTSAGVAAGTDAAAVPSTRDASYQPIADPSERG